jgi:hypothetical protein
LTGVPEPFQYRLVILLKGLVVSFFEDVLMRRALDTRGTAETIRVGSRDVMKKNAGWVSE